MTSIRNFLKDESGATIIEYGLLAALLGITLVGVLTGLGNELNELFKTVNNKLKAAG